MLLFLLHYWFSGIWNKCKNLNGLNKISNYYTIGGIISFQRIENSTEEQVTHLVDLEILFPVVDIDNL